MKKLLLYCVKAKPYLVKRNIFAGVEPSYFALEENVEDKLNGKIVAECDFEVEKIRKGWGCLNGTRYFRNNVNHYYPDYELEKQSCLSFDEIDKYLKGTLNENCGYAIHIKNLHIFDEPRELSYYYRYCPYSYNPLQPIKVAPQNMMYVYNFKDYDEKPEYILISIRPQWLCKILNGEKTIDIRKKILKEMIK